MNWNIYKKSKYRAGNIFSRTMRNLVEKYLTKPAVGMQLLAGVLFLGPTTTLVDPKNELNLSLGMNEVVIQVEASPKVLTETKAMQNPTANLLGISTYFQAGHHGWDFRAPLGSDIYPVTDGVVKMVAHSMQGYGRRVVVSHENGMESLYAHMGLIDVEEGQKVNKNSKLGEVGMTGMTTGPHIHLELYDAGKQVDPKYYIDLNKVPAI